MVACRTLDPLSSHKKLSQMSLDMRSCRPLNWSILLHLHVFKLALQILSDQTCAEQRSSILLKRPVGRVSGKLGKEIIL